MRSSTTRGVTLLSALIAFTLFGLAALMISRVFVSGSTSTARIDRSIRGDQVLTSTAAAFQQMDFEQILQACNSRSAFAGPVASLCSPDGQRIDPARGAASGTLYDLTALAVLRGVDGEALEWNPATKVEGNVFCIDLSECRRRAQGHVVEVTFMGRWADSSSTTGVLQSRAITFRRTRW